MAAPVTPPRGMRDFLPSEKAKRDAVLGKIRSVYRRFGFDEIETPVVEDAKRLHSGLGGDNEKLAYAVMRRGLDVADLHAASTPLDLADLGLRFDLTVPLARFFASHRGQLPTVFRSIQIAPVWRAERPQKGRFRQFVQCDIDILGEAGPIAEIELIQATAAAIDALGVRDTVIRINDRRVLTSLLASWNVPATAADAALIVIDKLDKIGPSGVAAELVELPGFSGWSSADLAATLEALAAADWESAREASWIDRAAFSDLEAIRASLPDLPIRFDPTLVRGMGYYTGTIFELAHPDLAYSLGGGGRYDGMIGRFLGVDVPAVGFSLGFERIVDLVELDHEADADAVVLLYDNDVDARDLARIKQSLVREHRRVRLERRAKNAKNQRAALAEQGFRQVGVVTAETADGPIEFRPLS
ncbi:histidine--tRNA ligase [Curtobacterium ammoniigenes]|uniref:histidine--tRNA ligase n=1 Tax=Curtobacterium ammoniigenes TaxID=395387 RepID=UPI0008327D0A|nr:histidine--tRNA ligase [Curtobacterium ammoniigenes]